MEHAWPITELLGVRIPPEPPFKKNEKKIDIKPMILHSQFTMNIILSFFEFGALGFWILAAIASIIFITAIETERFVVSTLVTLGLLFGYWKTIAAQEWTWRGISSVIGIYLLAGIFWSLFRWWRYAEEKVKVFNSQHSDSTRKDYIGYLKSDLNPTNHKATITSWIVYWPWNLAWKVIGNILTEIPLRLFDIAKGIYEGVSAKALEKVNNGIK